jgi:nucleotide-binding universal stress UspA family protein
MEVVVRILLATDGSRAADQARDLVAALPWQEGGRVRIVSVAPGRRDLSGVPTAADPTLRVHREALEAAEREISSARSDLLIEPVLICGRVATVIVDEARAMPADLIVVGHRGLGPWKSMLLGSVSSEVVNHATCPVLVARDERLGPVVFADDGSVSARTAEAVLTGWPLLSGLPVTVLTVAEDAFPYVGAREENEAAAGRLRDAGFEATGVLREGDPAHEIIAAARERGAGLIVVGTRGQTGVRRLILGSVARNVLLNAPCSVLVIREPVATSPSGGTRREDLEPVGTLR